MSLKKCIKIWSNAFSIAFFNLIKLFTKQMSNKSLIFCIDVWYNLLKKWKICVILYMGEILEIYKKRNRNYGNSLSKYKR